MESLYALRCFASRVARARPRLCHRRRASAARPGLRDTASDHGAPRCDEGRSGLFPTRPSGASRVAILANGDASFAARIQALRNARKSVRIQALIFTGDEAGLYIAELLKEKHAEGLDVRVIVDAFSNPSLQTQWMYFDLKQYGIEVEGYEALALQWLKEIPTPWLQPHAQPDQLNRRCHEKM